MNVPPAAITGIGAAGVAANFFILAEAYATGFIRDVTFVRMTKSEGPAQYSWIVFRTVIYLLVSLAILATGIWLWIKR